jgi:hypothetical protein
MRLCWAVVALGLLAGCAGGGSGPSLEAFSESDGVLHINGSGWKACSRVAVRLPEPWTGSEATVGGNGKFSLMYAHPEVKPYAGAVTATCAESPRQRATAQIHVGDARTR